MLLQIWCGWKCRERIEPSWKLKSCISFPAVKSYTCYIQSVVYCLKNTCSKKTKQKINNAVLTFSSLPSLSVATEWPTGLNLMMFMSHLCPLYVYMRHFSMMSQIFSSESLDLMRKISPNGWNSLEQTAFMSTKSLNQYTLWARV